MTALLACEGLDAGYNGKPVVRHFDLSVDAGEVLALLGPNGAGKTTVLLTLAGLLPRVDGRIALGDWTMTRAGAAAAAREGLVLVPDDRALFTTLSVRDHLVLAHRKRRPGMVIDDVLDFFPDLGKRAKLAAGQLSGGEQQMLALARAMVQRPKVLLVDELSMGLAPIIVQNLLPIVRKIATDTGAAVVLVEQHVNVALRVADRAMVLVHGRVALEGTATALLADVARLEHAYLGD